VLFHLEVGLAERSVDVALYEGESAIVYLVGDEDAPEVVVVELIL
jgi:hypothetical protein